MIGQDVLLKRLKAMIDSNTYPRYLILVGGRGSGKRLISKQIARWLHASDAVVETNASGVRTAIEQSYRTAVPVLYQLFDCDDMSNVAKDALLKVTEEPPNNAYFLMTLTNINNTLSTITSRATVLNMDPYSASEILEYCKHLDYSFTDEQLDIVSNTCSTPGQVDELIANDLDGIYNYAQKCFNHIATVSSSNSFKIADKLKLKDSQDGYDVELFLKLFNYMCANELTIKGALAGLATSDALQSLQRTGANKQMIIDSWILEVRRLWI